MLGHAERQRAVAAAAADGRHQVKLAAHPVPHGSARLRVGDPIIDDFIVFPGFPDRPERVPDVAALPRFLTVRMRRFDLAIQLHGSGALSNSIVGLLGARRQAGFHEAGSWTPDLVTCLPWGEPEHKVTRYLRLMQRLGCSGGDAALEFPFEAADRAAMAALEPLPPAGRYVCIAPARGCGRGAGRRRGSGRWRTASRRAAGRLC